MLVICIPVVLYASGLLQQVKPEDLGELSRGRFKLMSIIAGCEMDNKCVQVALTEIIKHDSHPVYENYLAELNEHQTQVEYEYVHCNIPSLHAYHKEVSSCLVEMLKKVNPESGLNVSETQKVEAQMNQCIRTKVEAIAKDGNLFAQVALMNNALKKKDMTTFSRWYDIIHQKQNTTLDYAAYKECQAPLQLFEWFQ